MLNHLRRSVILILLCTVIFGFAYAYVSVGFSQAFFTYQADGSITPYGSTLIGQSWSHTVCPGHLPGSCVFQGRPDDLGPYTSGDNPLMANGVSGESSGTSLGPRSLVLVNDTVQLVTYWRARGVDPTPDLVTTSGSGYDPDITAQDAIAEIPMVSASTGIAPSALRSLIARDTMGEEWGFLGTSYIDVLQLNEGLARLR
jgi:K+-transporting ATPase ATPase C chain